MARGHTRAPRLAAPAPVTCDADTAPLREFRARPLRRVRNDARPSQLEFLTLYFEIFAEIIHGVVAVDNGPKSGAGPPTADSVRKHVERALVAKRMWEFREALKAIILDKRLEAAEDTAQKAEEEAEMLAKRTADLEVAHKEFRALKNSTRDSLREAIRIADNQTEETKQATKDVSVPLRQVHADVLLAARACACVVTSS